MEVISHNELSSRQLKLRHIFFPGTAAFISETIVALVALFLFNITNLSDHLVSERFRTEDAANPISSWPHVVGNMLDGVGQYYIVQQAFLFLMWAIAGALIYILTFRMLQIGFGVGHSVKTGIGYVKQDHQRGVFRWLGSLHDFFITFLTLLLGVAAVTIGAMVCFGIASQELNDALSGNFPGNLLAWTLSLVAAVTSVRIIVFGLTMVSRRFRNWYTG
ncbi:MAG TPA: hypothetical protein VD706_02465 [Candidatus Saccharimonadales bacterium]|nr:hypothetical protein [Candidatus Saccharimonadales bacterium]